MLYLVLAVIFLHIIFAPIVICGAVYFDSDKKIAELSISLFFIPIFKKKFNYDNLMEKIGDTVKEKTDNSKKDDNNDVKKSNSVLKSAFKRYFIRVALGILRHIRLRRLDLEAEIGTGDAAVSAVTAGFMKTLYANIRALFYCDGGEEIVPNYDEEYIFIDFDGIISLCIGDIIYAAISAVKLPRRSLAANNYGAKNYGNAITE